MNLSEILLSFLKHKLGKASDSEPTESEIDHLSKLISVKLLNMTNAECGTLLSHPVYVNKNTILFFLTVYLHIGDN